MAQAQAAQASQVGKGSGKNFLNDFKIKKLNWNILPKKPGKNPSIADIQRAMELHRQYMLEMMPQGSVPSRQNNWKNN